MKGAVKRKGMPGVVQALCCPEFPQLQAFGAIAGYGNYKIAGAITNVKSLCRCHESAPAVV